MADANGAEKTTFIFKKPFFVFSDKIFKIPASSAPSHTHAVKQIFNIGKALDSIFIFIINFNISVGKP